MAEKKKTDNKNYSPEKLEVLITIVPRKKGDFYMDLIQQFEVNTQMVLQGSGTADNDMLRSLGLTDKDKTVILSLIKNSKLKEAAEVIDEKFNTIKGGKGISWSIPIDSVIGLLIYKFLSNNRQ